MTLKEPSPFRAGRNQAFTNLEFAIYRTILAFNNANSNPSHQQIQRAIQREFPNEFRNTTIDRTTRKMVEEATITKTDYGFRVPISLTPKAKAIEKQRFLRSWSK